MAGKEFKTVNVPIADHGVHSHPFNYPYVGSGRFMEVFPTYYEPLKKGESSIAKGGFYSLLLPLAQSAFFTGRYHFKGVFVPYTYVFRPWYEFQESKKYHNSAGDDVRYSQAPNCGHDTLTKRFIHLANGLVTLVSNPSTSPYNYDISVTDGTANYTYYKLTSKGARVLKVLNGLGIAPLWVINTKEPCLLINVLCYIKGFLDVYWPGQYVDTQRFEALQAAIKPEEFDYNNNDAVDAILNALGYCSSMFYDKSIFDYCWDTPSGPNSGAITPISIKDQTYGAVPSWNDSEAPVITNDKVHSPDDGNSTSPNNGAFISNPSDYSGGVDGFMGRITQFGLQALTSIANFMRRNQLVGSRLIDMYLAKHGIKLDNIDSKQSFVLGDEFVEINVSSIENNSDVHLGELAGKGVANTDPNKPMEFSCDANHDGVFIIYCSIEPDSDMPVYNDAYNSRIFTNDFYHGEFDKLGVEGVRQISAFNSMSGSLNALCQSKLFGFLNRYYGDIQEKPRLTGDFRINTRGAKSLSAYHSLRTFGLDTVLGAQGLYHSLEFVTGQNDMDQYQRIFYSADQDNLLLYIRWFGENKKHKLPLGDSYYWSDDEFNKKVKVLNQGMRR